MTTRRMLWVCLFVLTVLPGCGKSSGPTESSARAAIRSELDKWMSGSDSKASTFEARSKLYDLPISYSIRTVASTEPRVPTEVLVKYPDTIDDAGPAFRVVVDVEFKSQAGTPLTKVIEYNLTRIDEMNDWAIGERF